MNDRIGRHRKPPYALAQCGCGAQGRVLNIDTVRSSRAYDFLLQTINGDLHRVGVEWNKERGGYTMKHLGPEA